MQLAGRFGWQKSRRGQGRALACLAWLLGVCVAGAAYAQQDSSRPGWMPENSIGTGLPLLADPGGLRQSLWSKGITYQATLIEETLADVAGGARRGVAEDGRLEIDLDADLAKALGWKGAKLHASGYLIHGTAEPSAAYVGSIAAVSNIEALPSVKLYELWLQQKSPDGKISLRFGQLGADTEFVTSKTANLFMVSTVGWPNILAADLQSGGPAYPLATPGVRLGLYPNKRTAFLLGLFNGDSAAPGQGDPQQRDFYGVDFQLASPPFLIGEAQFRHGGKKAGSGLPGVVKLGAWAHSGSFSDQRYGTDGLPLASPLSTGAPVAHRGDQGVYAILDQTVYRPVDGEGGVSIFARASASPSDRNLIDLYADAGVTFSGFWRRRPDDSFGFAAAYSRISPDAQAYDRDIAFYSGEPSPVRSYEADFEATYSAQVMSGWTLQPDVQFILHPKGGAANLYDQTGLRPLPNALVVGLRTTVSY